MVKLSYPYHILSSEVILICLISSQQLTSIMLLRTLCEVLAVAKQTLHAI